MKAALWYVWLLTNISKHNLEIASLFLNLSTAQVQKCSITDLHCNFLPLTTVNKSETNLWMYYLPQTAVGKSMILWCRWGKGAGFLSTFPWTFSRQQMCICPHLAVYRFFCYRSLVMHLIPIGGNVRKIWALWALLQHMKSSQTSELSSISAVGFMVS